MLIVEIRPGEVDRTGLDQCQSAGQDGRLSAAMGAFLSWIARQYEELQQRLQMRAQELRSQVCRSAIHARLPGALAELQSGWEIWLQFALEVGAIRRREQAELNQRGQCVLVELGALQAQYQQASDPALGFLSLLQAAIAGGGAHVANPQGKVPDSPERWGWRRTSGRTWVGSGARIGWVASNDLFLEPTVSYQVAQQIAGGERLPVGPQTLRHRLHEHGLLASIDAGRRILLVHRTLESSVRQVLHLKATDLVA